MFTSTQHGAIETSEQAQVYLDYTKFDSGYVDSQYGAEQYAKGLQIGAEFDTVTISIYGTWGARSALKMITSYETLGYHSNTHMLLKGFIDSGVKIVKLTWGAEIIVKESTKH